MKTDWKTWRRLVKLDPARSLSDKRLEQVCSWDVDAIVVGGTGGYGAREVQDLLVRLRHQELPVALEVSDADTVSPGFDLYLVPVVLNSPHTEWLIGHHQAAVKKFGDLIDWERVVAEGYCILNPVSSAARLTQARTDLGAEDVVALARVAENLLGLPIFYLEYSGSYGSPELVRAVRCALKRALVWYGGGITTPEQADVMSTWADAIVVGNVLYEEGCPFPARNRVC